MVQISRSKSGSRSGSAKFEADPSLEAVLNPDQDSATDGFGLREPVWICPKQIGSAKSRGDLAC